MSDRELKPLGPEYRVEYPVNVILNNCKFRCTRCGKWKPAAQIGLRDDNGIIRNQPQCVPCRSRKPAKLELVK